MTGDDYRKRIYKLMRSVVNDANSCTGYRTLEIIESRIKSVQACANEARQLCNDWSENEEQ